MVRRHIWFVLAMLVLVPGSASAEGGFAGFFRSLTGMLGNRDDERSRRAPVTATIGVRGMDEGGTAAAGGSAPEDLKALDGWAANKLEARSAAKRRGVVARDVSLRER